MRPRWLWLVGLIFVLLPAVWGTSRYFSSLDERFRADLRQARLDLDAGRLLAARNRLAALISRRPADAEAAYLLGRCEAARKNSAAALESWDRVPANSPFATPVALARAELLLAAGKLGQAEDILASLPRDSGIEAGTIRDRLEFVYRVQGRTADIRRLVIEAWSGAVEPGAILRRLYLIDRGRFPTEMAEKLFAVAEPNDDRIWLARANVAILRGEPDEARHWLDQCRKRRPDDQAVWESYLQAARLNHDVDAAFAAMERLPVAHFSPTEMSWLEAWIAATSGDVERERNVLETLVAAAPGEVAAWDRLAELALADGADRKAEKYRRLKADMTDLESRYAKLLEGERRSEHAEEIAEIARRLGRAREARGWLLVRAGRGGLEPLEVESGTAATDQTLASKFAGMRPARGVSVHADASSHQASPQFRDDAKAAGLEFLYDNGHTGRRPPPPEAMGGGVGLLDFDGDGWLDVYLVQGGTFPSGPSTSQPADRLFRNRGDGTFEDATQRAGLAEIARGYGHGVSVGDYDNDGRPDLFVTRWRAYALYRNRGDGTFEDATGRSGLGGNRDWPTSSAFADFDGDGDLDLYVCHYLKYDETNPTRCSHPDSPARHECNPLDFEALPDHVFRNDGGRFVDVTAGAGFSESTGRGLGVVAADFDGDGLIDVYVANDMSANYLYRNRGGFRFEETGIIAGASASAEGGYKAGMGIACGDLDGDTKIDLAVTNYYGESTTFFRNMGSGMFVDHSEAIGMSGPTRLLLGFGIEFVDVNNDGRLDVLSANGHVIDARPQFPWMMPIQLLAMRATGRLADVSARAGALFRPSHLGRGLVSGDLDNDGRVDALVVCQNEPVVYLHNQTTRNSATHFVAFRLEGTKSNRDAVGAVVTIEAGGRRQLATRFGGGSYQSARDPRVYFGIGSATKVESVEIRWPSGDIDRLSNLGADAGYRLREGTGVAERIKAFRSEEPATARQ